MSEIKQWTPGDRVQWTHITSRGSSIQLSAWDGIVLSQTGDLVTVKRRGKQSEIHANRLRKIGERNELTELLAGKVTE